MLSQRICNPILVFPVVWMGLIFVLLINNGLELLDFNRLSILLYIYLLVIIFFWVTSGLLALVAFKIFFNRIHFKTSEFFGCAVSVKIILFLSVIYILFKIFDIYIITGQFSLMPFNIENYRYRLTEDSIPSFFNFIHVLNSLFFSLPAIIFYLYRHSNKNDYFFVRWLLLIFFVMFLYFSTARSAAFVSIVILFFVLAYNNVKLKFLLIVPLILFLVFGIMGALVGKSGFDTFFIYLLAPLHAFDFMINNRNAIEHELLSFRPFHGLLYSMGVMTEKFHLLSYVETPFPVNVYTVFGVYFHDFGFSGLLLFIAIISFISTLLHLYALKYRSVRFQLLSSFYLSFIILGVFYDYYSSSMFSFLAPIMILVLLPKNFMKIK
jgi:oligosaccharide repeat unit polymerase